jgi:lipopolysaccharide cholinephosphotransferase
MGKLIVSIKNRGFLGTFRYASLKVLGLDGIQDEVDTLHYFLNLYRDVSNLPPTNDKELRNVQLGILELFKIFDKQCSKYNLTYCLQGGNCLGAYRHKGFIPWDDDGDVIMPRGDYDKVIDLMRDELSEYGISIHSGGYFDNRGAIERLAIEYDALKTGIWIDIFPVDIFHTKGSLAAVKDELTKATLEYIRYYKRNIRRSASKISEQKAKIYGKYDKLMDGENSVCVNSVEFTRECTFIDAYDVFPPKRMAYEGFDFPVPNNTDAYLRMMYGDDYMGFPLNGVEHHREPDGGLVKTRARRNNIDMAKVISYLSDVYDRL